MEQEQILKTDDKAAKYVTGLSGWVDRNGHYWGENEDQARYSGCTHIACEKCGTIRIRNDYCSPCHEKKKIENYNGLEKRKWDGETPLYSDAHDEYFFDSESMNEYAEEHGISLKDMRLRLCCPVLIQQLDESYFLEDQHEDAELPTDIARAVEDLNKVIRAQIPITWTPDKYAAAVEL